MALQVLVAPDKFKGTLTAEQAAQAMAAGWRSQRPEDELQLLPISDGGDGFGQIISNLLEAEPQVVKAVDPAHRPCDALWWWHAPTRTAIVEAARIVGLAQLPVGKYHPFELDTEGLGVVLNAAAQHGAVRCLAGIGGSATNDAGFGLARAVGWQFFGKHDEKLTRWTELRDLAQVRPPEQPRLFESLSVAVDVQNPLLGPNGCTRIYGPQKGLRPDEFEFAERCLEQLARIMALELHTECAGAPGAGAAGGLGFGLRCFANGQLEPGFALFARHAKLVERLGEAQLVLTGEGAIDHSTIMGKGVGELARLCKASGVHCLGLGGMVADPARAKELFTNTYALTPDLASPREVMGSAAFWLEKLAAKAAQEWAES
jgi:glycerate kinase